MTTAPHLSDTDCTVAADGTCTGCGVWHGDPCPTCNGAGFHKPGCEERSS